jgi:hypothetical protein
MRMPSIRQPANDAMAAPAEPPWQEIHGADMDMEVETAVLMMQCISSLVHFIIWARDQGPSRIAAILMYPNLAGYHVGAWSRSCVYESLRSTSTDSRPERISASGMFALDAPEVLRSICSMLSRGDAALQKSADNVFAQTF